MKLLNRLHKRLPGDMRRALEAAVTAAERRSVGLCLVGGAVRDLLMNAGHVDIDLVVEGDAIALAGAVGKKLRGRVVKHPRFGTASLLAGGARLDFAGARTESYLHPGALPSVQPSDLLEDLARRDFTINAMALPMTSEPDPEKITMGMPIEVVYQTAPRKDADGNEYLTYYFQPRG